MASQLKVDTLTGVTTAGSIVVTGEGNSTTTNLQQGLAKCWVNVLIIRNWYYRSRHSLTGQLTDDGTGTHTSYINNNMSSMNMPKCCKVVIQHLTYGALVRKLQSATAGTICT